MEKIEFMAYSLSIKDFRERNNMCTNEEIDENFSSLLSSYLKSSSCNLESKCIFLEEFSKYIENEIEALEFKIQSQDSHYQSLSFQNSFQLSFDIKTKHKDMFDDPKLKQWYGRNCPRWYDPIAKYMEEFFNPSHFIGLALKMGFRLMMRCL